VDKTTEIIVDAFKKEAIRNLMTTAGINIAPQANVENSDLSETKYLGYTAVVQFKGCKTGYLLINNTKETAIYIANRMKENILGDTSNSPDLDECGKELLVELANTLVGLATNVIAGNHIDLRIKPTPFFIDSATQFKAVCKHTTYAKNIKININESHSIYLHYLEESNQKEKKIRIKKDAKLLVCDDVMSMRMALITNLNKLGFSNILEATNGSEAYRVYKEQSPDLIFLDIIMPEQTGDKVLKKIRETDNSTPVMMITSIADQKMIGVCDEFGISGYITKPITISNGQKKLTQFIELI